MSACLAEPAEDNADGPKHLETLPTETSQDECPHVPKWNELSIIERVGLNR